MRRFYIVRVAVLAIFTLLFTGCTQESVYNTDETPVSEAWSESIPGTEVASETGTEVEAPEEEDVLTVHYIDVGQGDATLLVCGKEAMLIDGGNNSKGTAVQKYLLEQGIEALKYVIATHPDSDHIGGLDVVLYKFDFGNIFMPEVVSETKSYQDLVGVLTEKGKSGTQPAVGEQFFLGSALCTVLGPSGVHENNNDYSIALSVQHGENTFLFTGDASVETEEEMAANGLIPRTTVYKAGHHGSSNSSSGALLEAAKPEYAVVSCGYLNSHGHPHKEVTEALKDRNIKLFRTDLQGTVIVTSDGHTVTFNAEPTGEYASGTELKRNQESVAEPSDEEQTYILNNGSMKFHNPDCKNVSSIAEHNRQSTSADREELIERGYEPCGWCKP